MKYSLPTFDYTPFYKVYAGSRSRYATATAAAFIDESRILIAQFLSKKIYLADITNGLSIVSEIRSNHYTDLMDYHAGRLYCANYPAFEDRNGSMSIFDVAENKISLLKEYEFAKIKCHGCSYANTDYVIVTSVGEFKRGLLFVNAHTGCYELFDDFIYYPKDVLIEDNKMYVITSASRPDKTPVEILDSMLYIFDIKTMSKIIEFKFHGQTDAITKIKDDILITLQGQHSLAHFREKNGTLVNVGYIKGFDFPHGIASYGDRICVTNYGDNSVEIFNDIEELYQDKNTDYMQR